MTETQSESSRQNDEQPLVDGDRQATGKSGCLSAFMVLWGIAFLLVGLLIAGVSGICGLTVIKAGGARDFGGIITAGLIIGVFLCILGYSIMRHAGRDL